LLAAVPFFATRWEAEVKSCVPVVYALLWFVCTVVAGTDAAGMQLAPELLWQVIVPVLESAYSSAFPAAGFAGAVPNCIVRLPVPVPVEEIEFAVMLPELSTVALAPGVLTEDDVAAATIAPGVNPLNDPAGPAGPGCPIAPAGPVCPVCPVAPAGPTSDWHVPGHAPEAFGP